MAGKAKKGIVLLFSFFYVVGGSFSVKAEALPEIMSGSTTLADNIMSYYALSGSAVANTDWINTLYNSYGTNFGTVEELANQGYLVFNESAGVWEGTQQLGQMIEQAPAYTSLGLNEMFNVSAQEVAAGGGFAAASGGSILAGSLGGVASTGVLTLFGGVTVAYWGGIALGTLANHAIDYLGKVITDGLPITDAEYVNSLPAGHGTLGFLGGSKDSYVFSVEGYPFSVLDSSTNIANIVIKCITNNNKTYTVWNLTTNRRDQNGSITFVNNIGIGPSYGIRNYSYFPINHIVSNGTEFNQYLAGLRNNTISVPSKYSPDSIGGRGNNTGDYDSENNKYVVPEVKPQIDPGQQAGKPLTKQDWLNFANAVQNNNNQTNPTGLNAELFSDILDRIVVANPDPNPNPNPDTNPYPDPHPNPDPDQVPVPDYNDPEQETQPDYDSETERVPNPEDGKPWVTNGLLDKFPFCIPKDLMNMAKNFNSGTRQAPEIEWRFNPPNTPIDYTFHLDLSDFEAVAVLLRTLELALFVVGLAFATRYLIGAS